MTATTRRSQIYPCPVLTSSFRQHRQHPPSSRMSRPHKAWPEHDNPLKTVQSGKMIGKMERIDTLPNITQPLPSMKATRDKPSQFLKLSHT
eukprot:6488511-Amphidinium_carterae.2